MLLAIGELVNQQTPPGRAVDNAKVCGECVVASGGRIVKYIGDSILAVFPEDAADRAVSAGACMRKEYSTLVTAQQTNVDSDLEVGISFGQVEEGSVRLSKEIATRALEPYHPKWRENPLIVWEVVPK